MITNFFLGYILLLILPVVLSAFFFWLLFFRIKLNEKLFFLPFIPGLILWLLLSSYLASDLVVIKPDLSVAWVMVLGDADYETPFGKKVHVHQVGPLDVYIVNNSNTPLILENIAYGNSFAFNLSPTILPPHRVLLRRSVPDYFPQDTPPSTISVQKGIKGGSKEWLRPASAEETQEAREDSELLPE